MKMISTQKKLVSEILDIVHLSGEQMVVNCQTIKLQKAVDTVLPMIHPLSEANEIELVIEIPNNLTCSTDEKMLGRVLSNIFINAVQNTAEHGKVHIWTENKVDDILLCVSNTGGRIDEAFIPKLFEPFFRLDQARSSSSGHSGLGLTIVKRILDKLEIPFALENTDTGVLFWMHLPKS